MILKELQMFLVNWLKNHILTDDKKYQKLFLDNGIK